VSTMNKIKVSGILLAIAMCSCVSATVEESNVCYFTDVGTIPAAPVAGIIVPNVSFSKEVDLSDAIKGMSDVAEKVTVVVNSLMLDGDSDLSWVNHMDVSIAGNSADTPDAALAHYESNGTVPIMKLPITVQMDPLTAYRYLSHPVTLTFTIAGTTTTVPVNMSSTLCVGASAQFNKSL
jgi:hypothetical protein